MEFAALVLALALLVPASAKALVLCARLKRDGGVNTSLQVRDVFIRELSAGASEHGAEQDLDG
jgi:hypothetical protein